MISKEVRTLYYLYLTVDGSKDFEVSKYLFDLPSKVGNPLIIIPWPRLTLFFDLLLGLLSPLLPSNFRLIAFPASPGYRYFTRKKIVKTILKDLGV